MSLSQRAIEEFGACQKQAELEQLIAYLADMPLRRVLEIGTQDGGTRWVWTQLAHEDALVLSIDLDPVQIYGPAHAGEPGHIVGDSHSREVLGAVEDALGGMALDLLFIDGDHSYDGVKQDFEMYSPLVRTGGVIALHDVVKHESPEASEVERFWLELLPGHPEALAFVDDGLGDTWRGKLPPMSCGIGVIRQH